MAQSSEIKNVKDWVIRVISAVIALHVVVASCIGAAYAFAPAVLGDTSGGMLVLVALAFAATFSGVPVLAKLANDRAIWVFSKLLKG